MNIFFSAKQHRYHACLDTGTQTTVTGLKQGKGFCRYVKAKLNLQESINKYKLRDEKQSALGSLLIRLPVL